LRFSGFKNEKFAAKSPEAGNLSYGMFSQFLDSPTPASASPVNVFHSIFSQPVEPQHAASSQSGVKRQQGGALRT
jgi:hypothetical protein